MKRTLLVAVSIMLLLFAFTACTNDNGSTSVDEDTAQNIAKEMNLNELVNDVFSAKEGDGVIITYTLGSDAQAQAAAVPRSTGYTLTATVTFDGYSYSSVTINSGVLRYIFTGSLTGSHFSASSYRIETERELVVQSSNASDTVDVVINVNETTEAAFSATLTSTEVGETSIAANTQVSVSVTIPADDSVTIDNQPVKVEKPTQEPDPEPVYLSARAMASGENISSLFGEGVTVDDVQSNVSITSSGTVTGSFNYVSAPNWGVDDEDEGYYLLVTFDVAEDTEVTVNDKTVADNDWALFLGADPKAALASSFAVTAGGRSVTLRISNSSEFESSDSPFDGGTGTEDFPYLISTEEQLGHMVDAEYSSSYFKLNSDIELTDELILEKSEVTLDLNGKTISASLNTPLIYSIDSNLTINGDGELHNSVGAVINTYGNSRTIINGGTYKSDANNGLNVGATKGTAPISEYWGGELVINDATVEAREFAIGVYADASLIINDGTFKAEDNAVIGTNGTGFSSDPSYPAYEIEINGGTITGEIKTSGYIACGIYMANTGTVTLNGGEFDIHGGIGVLVRSGTLIANDATINLTAVEGRESGKVGDSRVMIVTGNSEIVVDTEADYPGGDPVVSVNTTGYTPKNQNGEEYIPESNNA